MDAVSKAAVITELQETGAMDFYAVLDQVIELLQRHKRVTYRALKLQFELDDETLDTLKDELLFAHPVVDEDGRGLVWTGEAAAPSEPADGERQFQELILTVLGLLQCERRVTYRRLKDVFSLDDPSVAALREELTLRQLAVDEANKVLVWSGFNGMSTPPDALSANAPSDNPSVATQEQTQNVPEAERRQLTVMFCDLADSTQLSQQLDPEDLREVIRSYQQTSAEVIERFDGYIAQHLGDGLLIYFGWPQAHEDDAQRALHAGLGIVDAITATLNPLLQQKHRVQLTVRLGVHTGPVVVGEMGSGGRHENLATGKTVNIAARLEALAQPNTVVMSSATERLLRGAFTLEDLGTHALKGVAEPMQLYHVLGPAEVYHDEDERGPDRGVFLVGRDEEVGLLLRRWKQSKEGLGQVVLISGEAGIGKSSLIATVRRHVSEAAYTPITFRCSPYHTNSALHPVITFLEQMLGFEHDDTPGSKLDKLEQALRATHLPLEESVPLLAALLSVPLADRYPTPVQSSQRQRQQTLDTLVAWLMEASETQPMLAVWEDLHWADPSTLEMLGLVLEQTPTVSMLNVLTFRPEFSPPWPSRSHIIPITLNRLERPQVQAFITHLAGDKTLPVEVVEHIVTKTDGVPLYVEELTRMLLDTGLLREEVDTFVLTGPLLSVAIPDTLQDSLTARLDQLGTAKEVAQFGAVCGREFPYDLLRAISPQDDDTLRAGLSTLVQAELLYQRGRPPRATYMFKHALLQDAAHASLLRRTRQQLHQQIAQLLESRFPEVVETQPELLAHHYTEAGLSERAVLYWGRAGERAHMRSANLEAISHLHKGLSVLGTLSDTPERDRHELTLQTMLGQTLKDTQGYGATEVASVYTRVRELCQQSPESSELFRALLGQSIYCIARAELQSAYKLGERLLEFAQRDRDPVFLVEAYYALGASAFWLGKFIPAREYLTQGIAYYAPNKHQAHIALFGQDGGAVCLCRVAVVLWYLGFPDQALTKSQEALTLVRQLAHPFSMAYIQLWTALFHHLRREPLKAQEHTEAVMTLSIEQGFPYWSTQATIMQGWIAAQQGLTMDGIAQMQQGLAKLHKTGTIQLDPYFFGMLADVYWKAGQIKEGLRALDKVLASVNMYDARYNEAELYRLKGDLLWNVDCGIRNAEWTPETCFQKALDIARQQQARSWELRAATSLARLWQSQGKRQEAHNLLAPVYNWFTEGFDTADLQEAQELLAELT